MKIFYTIIFTIFIKIGFSQSNPDSLKLMPNDSLQFNSLKFPSLVESILDTNFIWYQTNSSPFYPPIYLVITIPNCSELINRDGLFYFGQDTLSYCGYCAVLHNGVKRAIHYNYPNIFYYSEGFFIADSTNSLWNKENFITNDNDKIKIISTYKDGQRHGPREYYDINGKLYKIEIYKNGKLESTQYFE